MGILRFLVWTGLCIGLGIFLATADVGGRTPLEHLTRAWKQTSPRLERVKGDAGELVEGVKKKVATKEAPAPTERHAQEDRDAVDAIIAKRAQK